MTYLMRDWPVSEIFYRFGGDRLFSNQGVANGISYPNSDLQAITKKAFAYVEGLFNVKFTFKSSFYEGGIAIWNGDIVESGLDGLSINDLGKVATRSEIFIEPENSKDYGLFLHELGHTLGLEHPSVNYGVGQSIMWNIVPQNVTKYGTYDIALLNSVFGSSSAYKGDWHGSIFNDTLYGGKSASDSTDNSERIYGYAGNDTLYGCGGNDTIYGGSGTSDTSDVADLIYGGAGNDLIYGNTGNDTIHGGAGNDTINGGGGNDIAYATSGTDVFYGGAGADIFYATRTSTFADFQSGIDSIFYI
jgi:hypothetical protein